MVKAEENWVKIYQRLIIFCVPILKWSPYWIACACVISMLCDDVAMFRALFLLRKIDLLILLFRQYSLQILHWLKVFFIVSVNKLIKSNPKHPYRAIINECIKFTVQGVWLMIFSSSYSHTLRKKCLNNILVNLNNTFSQKFTQT